MSDDTEKQKILELEKQRCTALVVCDIAALSVLLSDDLTHIHGSGHIDGKADYLKDVESKFIFHRVERGALDVRIYGSVAIVIGSLEQTLQLRSDEKRHEINAIVSQTWIKEGESWKQNCCHMHFLNVA